MTLGPDMSDIYTGVLLPNETHSGIFNEALDMLIIRYGIILNSYKYILSWLSDYRQATMIDLELPFTVQDVWTVVQHEVRPSVICLPSTCAIHLPSTKTTLSQQ